MTNHEHSINRADSTRSTPDDVDDGDDAAEVDS